MPSIEYLTIFHKRVLRARDCGMGQSCIHIDVLASPMHIKASKRFNNSLLYKEKVYSVRQLSNISRIQIEVRCTKASM
jgi:hypothetical protein